MGRGAGAQDRAAAGTRAVLRAVQDRGVRGRSVVRVRRGRARMTSAEAAALVDEHHGAMRRLARLVGRGADDASAVRRAWGVALARPHDRPARASTRGWLLRLVLDEL